MNRVKIKLSIINPIKELYKLQVNVYNIEYHKDFTVITIDEDDLEKIEKLNFEILSFRGLKFILKKLKNNIHFLISIALSILIMYLLSNVCFSVNVIHSKKEIRTLIEDELYDHGIKPFSFKKRFKEIGIIKETIKNEYPNDIEWLEIIDDGMKYTVRVEERIITKEKKSSDFCNVISTKDATILGITSSHGQTLLTPGSIVKKGDTLISGEIKFNEEAKARTCAEGVVYGNTWYKISVSIPLNYTKKEYTNKKKNNLAFELGTKYNRIFKVHFDEYDVDKVKIFGIGNFALYKESIKEYKSIKSKYSKEEALEEAKKRARENLLTNIGDKATILDEKVLQTDDYNSIISVEIFYSVKEIISKVVEAELPTLE